MLKKLFNALLLSGLAFGLQAAEDVAKLQAYLQQLQSLEGSFEQLTLDARGQRLQEARGTMSLQKPGRFYWHTEMPYPQLLVSNGETLWVYDPDLEQVTIQKMDQRMANTPALILSGDAKDLTSHFDIQYVSHGKEEEFRMTPLGSDSLFEVLRLYFVDGQISALQLEDSLGQQTRVDLLINAYNQPLDQKQFEFEPPTGVDVIQE
jgi:outer membrane lipoprotein carrier protein